MKTTLHWLQEYTDIKSSPAPLAAKMTLAGLAVDGLEEIGTWPGVVVGRVLSVDKHPNADKLSVTSVDIGSEQLKIVCGASNVCAGQLVPVATVGAVLPGGFEIKKAKIRGEDSFGMICSKSELGLEKEKSPGIWALENSRPVTVGSSLSSFLGTGDVVFDIDVTSNRPDCLSMIGLAREVAVMEGAALRRPDVTPIEGPTDIRSMIRVTIEDTEGCPRYMARVIQGVKIGPSPDWLVGRLESVGLRSINNVVDITNFVMLEYGQPLHSFDYDRIAGKCIVVRKSKKGERFETLDGKTHTLNDEIVMICDGERSVALGGIMGGQNSEVTPGTTNILLESANFDLLRTRRSAKFLGIQTDASIRFGKGVDPGSTATALDRAAELMRTLAGGTIAKGVVDEGVASHVRTPISLNFADIEKLLGVAVPAELVCSILRSLECVVSDRDQGWTVQPPTHRADLKRPADLIEEIIRIYGYDRVPYADSARITYAQNENLHEEFDTRLRSHLKEAGFSEIVTNPMVRLNDQHAIEADAHVVKILNPINDDMAVMRISLLPGLLEVVRGNLARGNHNLRLYEAGRCYSSRGPNELAIETTMVAGCICGDRDYPHWSRRPVPGDIFDVKNVISSVCGKFLLDTVRFSDYHHPRFAGGALVASDSKGTVLGYCGRVERGLLSKFDISKDVWYFELVYDAIEKATIFKKTYRSFSRFPAVQRDLALVVEGSVAAGDLMADIQSSGGDILRSVDVFDVYTGDQVSSGKKSIAFTLQFRSDNRTLTDAEVDAAIAAILDRTGKQFGAVLR